MTKVIVTEEEIFPEKPTREENSRFIVKSFLSLVLFIGSFYFFFEKDIKSISIFVVSIFIHELGHFLAMKFYHYKDVKMFFVPFLGAFVMGEKEEISQRQRSIILLAGPIPGIIIGFFLLIVGFVYGKNDLNLAGMIFLFLNLFNLIPFSPFDGGRLIETIFFNKKESLQIFFLAISSIGIAIIAILMESYILFIFPVLLFFQISNLFKFSRIRSDLESKEVKLNKSFYQLTDREYWLIRDQVISNFDYYKEIGVRNYTISKKEHQIINIIKQILTDQIIPDLSGIEKILILFTWSCFFLLPTSAMMYLYSNSDPRQDQVIEQCITFNRKEADLNLELYRDYCYCISDSVLRYIDKTAEDEKLKKEINFFLNPDLHPICNSEFLRKN